MKIGHSWYLRGHVGMANQHFDGLDHPSFENPNFFEWLDKGGFDGAPIGGLGIGLRLSKHFRVDLTGEYRGGAAFKALDRYEDDDTPGTLFDDDEWGINDYKAKKSEWLFLANAYYDIAKWHKFTPYVGGGIGVSRNTISHFRDNNIIQAGGGYADTGHQWNFAWALHAGMGWKVTDKVTVDLGYSFVSLGDAQTDTLYNYDSTCVACESMKFKNLYSHDFKLGVRYDLSGGHKSYDYPKYNDYPPPPVVKY